MGLFESFAGAPTLDLGLYDPSATSRAARASRHVAKVARVAQHLRARTGTKPVSFRKRAVAHQVPKHGDLRRSDDKVDLTDLDEILEIDPDARTCVAEPGATFAAVARATLRYGLVPMVVPEFKTITLGGAVAGCSLESMSYKYGGFHDGCTAYEIVTAKGEVLQCTPDNEHALVFQMVHGSFGTLGVLTKLTFRLVPAKPFVRMRYERSRSVEEYRASIARNAADGAVDFLDGFVFSPTEYVLNVGTFVDRAPYTTSYDWYRVFYESARTRSQDYLTTEGYFFRYDNGVTNVHPKTALGRLFFGKVLHSANLFRLAERFHIALPKQPNDVTLDMFLPESRLDAYLSWHARALAHYPLWVVPYKRVRDYEWIASAFFAGMTDEMFIDLAIYGMPQPAGRNCYREIEEQLESVNGIKTLISYNYYERDEFWRIFNKPNYDAVKRITDPDNAFRDLYEKMCRAARGLG